jgi:hypothetical protein
MKIGRELFEVGERSAGERGEAREDDGGEYNQCTEYACMKMS